MPRRCERDIASRRHAGPLGEHLGLVVVDRDPARLLDEAAQLGAVEHRQALARVEDEGHAGGDELGGVAQHRLAAIGRDDRQRQVAARRDVDLVRRLHRPRVEGGDLVVVEVGHDEGLGGEGVVDRAHRFGRHAPRLQPLDVAEPVAADRRHHHGLRRRGPRAL